MKEELYQELLNKGQQLLALTPEGPDSNTAQDLANLRDKWEAVQGKVTERKVRQLWCCRSPLLLAYCRRSLGPRESTKEGPRAVTLQM